MENDRLTILLAEDSEVNQQLVAQILRRKGYDVIVAADGLQAIRLCGQHPVDLFLMDIEMPNLSGLEAAQRIRQLENYADTPIIALTGHDDAENQQVFLDAGMDFCLTKPLNLRKLDEAIKMFYPDQVELSSSSQPKAEQPQALDTSSVGHFAQLFDKEELLEKVGGKLNFALHIMQLFFKGAEEVEPLLVAAIEDMDRDAIRRHAHRIKGSMANASFIAGLDAITQLEKTAQTADQEEMRKLYQHWKKGSIAIHDEFMRMAKAFMAERAAKKPAN